MRFSSLFQQQAPRPADAVVSAPPAPAPAAAVPTEEAPAELDPDARVRLVGEWQLFEG